MFIANRTNSRPNVDIFWSKLSLVGLEKERFAININVSLFIGKFAGI